MTENPYKDALDNTENDAKKYANCIMQCDQTDRNDVTDQSDQILQRDQTDQSAQTGGTRVTRLTGVTRQLIPIGQNTRRVVGELSNMRKF